MESPRRAPAGIRRCRHGRTHAPRADLGAFRRGQPLPRLRRHAPAIAAEPWSGRPGRDRRGHLCRRRADAARLSPPRQSDPANRPARRRLHGRGDRRRRGRGRARRLLGRGLPLPPVPNLPQPVPSDGELYHHRKGLRAARRRRQTAARGGSRPEKRAGSRSERHGQGCRAAAGALPRRRAARRHGQHGQLQPQRRKAARRGAVHRPRLDRKRLCAGGICRLSRRRDARVLSMDDDRQDRAPPGRGDRPAAGRARNRGHGNPPPRPSSTPRRRNTSWSRIPFPPGGRRWSARACA